MAVSFERNGSNPIGRPHFRPRFIKILTPKSLITLAVPHNFVKHLDKSALKTFTLFTLSGRFWHIQVLLNKDDESDVQFGRGWELFVRAHDLKPGNVVLFRYEGNAIFSVKNIFQYSNGCNCLAHDQTVKNERFKPPTNCTANKKRKKKLENPSVKAKVFQKTVRKQLSKFKCILQSYNVDPAKAQIYLPKGLISATKSEIISLDCLGQLWPVRLWVGNKQIAISTGWKQLVRETKLEEGDKCIFEIISQGVLGLKIERKS